MWQCVQGSAVVGLHVHVWHNNVQWVCALVVFRLGEVCGIDGQPVALDAFCLPGVLLAEAHLHVLWLHALAHGSSHPLTSLLVLLHYLSQWWCVIGAVWCVHGCCTTCRSSRAASAGGRLASHLRSCAAPESAEVPKRSGRHRRRKMNTRSCPSSSNDRISRTCVMCTGDDAPRYTTTRRGTGAGSAQACSPPVPTPTAVRELSGSGPVTHISAGTCAPPPLPQHPAPISLRSEGQQRSTTSPLGLPQRHTKQRSELLRGRRMRGALQSMTVNPDSDPNKIN